MILTVKITFTDGTTDIRDCHKIEDIPLDELNMIIHAGDFTYRGKDDNEIRT